MAVITIVDTGVISFVSTRNLAERFGFGPLLWLYPLCLDAVAAVGMDLWMSDSQAQRLAKWLALSARCRWPRTWRTGGSPASGPRYWVRCHR